MGFLSQFSAYFKPEERETELYKMWSAIGVNMEKSIVEEQNKLDSEISDINFFTEDTLRSWLAFFLQKIPYRTTATCQVTASLNGNYQRTEIPQYEQLRNSDGYIYTTLQSITLTGSDKRTVTAVQGKRIIESGTYNNIIKVQANNPDLTYISVKVNGEEIPEVSYQTSYDQLSFIGSWKPQNEDSRDFGGTPFIQNKYGGKGQFYTVIGDGECKFSEDGIYTEFKTGDIIVYDGNSWQRSASSNNLKPIQFTNTFAVPSNGYFVYYYNNYLYIKIFSGTSVDNPEGKIYEVSYITSDGIQGETDKNTLSFVSEYEDVDENTVELEVSNTKSSVAVNEPSIGKLGLYLKQRLYGSINVSSIPEYTAWFKAQPEVGDALVLSDYERYKRSGKFENTGIVSIYLADNNGNELSDEIEIELLDRLEPYKDIAAVQVNSFTTVEHYLKFEYTTASATDPFEQFVKAKASQYYNLSYLQSTNGSLFDDLDLAAVIQDIQENSSWSSTGLILKGYHYKKIEILNATSLNAESYANECVGKGWYTVTCYDKDSNDDYVIKNSYKFVEDVTINGVCYIYDTSDMSLNSVGTHINTNVSLDLSNEKYKCDKTVIECYWGMENEGILSIGISDGLRKLHGVDISKVG